MKTKIELLHEIAKEAQSLWNRNLLPINATTLKYLLTDLIDLKYRKVDTMDKTQFSELMGKLEEIRCGIIDVEDNTSTEETTISQIRTAFFHQLSTKTGWGRNEIKALFDIAVESAT